MWDWFKGLFSALGSMFSGARPHSETPAEQPEPIPPPREPSRPAPTTGQHTSSPATPQPPLQSFEPIAVEIEKREGPRGANWFARVSGEEFLVGADVRYESRRGLMLRAPASGYVKYDPDEWRAAHGVWADMIAVTSEVEGKGDLCTVNTYDRAGFTFGLMQWAAHTPNDNFVLLMRKLLALPSAPAYFPDLRCQPDGGRIVRQADADAEVLETADSTTALRRYLNPDEGKVDEAEVIAAAKLMHWIRTDAAARTLLINFALEHYRHQVRAIAEKVPLNGKTDVEVLVCADIRHQGRGTYAQMRSALHAARSVEALLAIGADRYPERITGLREGILNGLSQRRFGLHRYNAASGEMVRSEEGPPATPSGWPEAHATRRNITRNDRGGVYKLSEQGAPARDPSADSASKAEALRRIALWLDPKGSARYQRGESGRTRCNIYAYDFVTLAGAYLPRVWWDGVALNEINAGGAPEVRFPQDNNVVELTANALLRWFQTHSSRYGWRQVGDVRTLQDHANAGGLAVIVARHSNEGASGHITVVAPEGSTDENGRAWTAKRDGAPFLPLQSQAGGSNFSFGMLDYEWWKGRNMAEHGFWVHD